MICKYFLPFHKLPFQARAVLRKTKLDASRFNFKLYDEANPTVWYWHKNRHTDQWNRIESPEINPCTYSQSVYDKGDKKMHWRKDNLS